MSIGGTIPSFATSRKTNVASKIKKSTKGVPILDDDDEFGLSRKSSPKKNAAKENKTRRLIEEDEKAQEEEEKKPRRKKREVALYKASSDEVDLPKPTIRSSGKRLSKTEVDKLQSLFGDKVESILGLVEDNDNAGAISLTGRLLLQTLVDVLPILENSVRRSKGRYGAYQFNQTVSQIRELMAELQAAQERGAMGERIVERFVKPTYINVATQIVQAFVEIQAQGRERMKEQDFIAFDRFLNDLKRSLADFMTKSYNDMSESIVKSLT